MDIIGVYRSFFDGLGGFVSFMNTPFSVGGLTLTPITCFGVGLGGFLLVVFALHLAHLINPVG